MQLILVDQVQAYLNQFSKQPVYIHLETTQGAYAARDNDKILNSGAYIRNAQIQFLLGKITGNGPYRVGLKMENGWVYAEGITHWEINEAGQLLLSGHDLEGRLAVALELSRHPFS
ncbi:MAG TPA: YojF family protein [Bacillota bacterium]|nr:YojF family protein [Bacillota bacterium]